MKTEPAISKTATKKETFSAKICNIVNSNFLHETGNTNMAVAKLAKVLH